MASKPIQGKIILNIALPGALVERIDNYRYKNHIPSRAEAIRGLIELGLKRDTGKAGE